MASFEKVSLALPREQVSALKAAIEAGEYATISEIVREALRDWQLKRELRQEDLKRLRQMWDAGIVGGPTVAIRIGKFRIDLDRLGDVGDRPFIIAFARERIAAIFISPAGLRIDPHYFGIVGDRTVEVAFAQVDIAAVSVKTREVRVELNRFGDVGKGRS